MRKERAHHIVQEEFDAAKATVVDSIDWMIKESQDMLTEVGLETLTDPKKALAMAKAIKAGTGNPDDFLNMTWAINGNGTHTNETITTVYNLLKPGRGNAAAIKQVLTNLKNDFMSGARISEIY